MLRLGRAISRGAGREEGTTRFRGIRFRLGLWLAIALLPLLILGGLQTEAAFRSQDADRRSDLQRAAERSAAAARARLDSTGILLLALMPEVPEMSCSPRLSALVSRVEGLDGVGQVTATGALVCASESLAAAPPA